MTITSELFIHNLFSLNHKVKRTVRFMWKGHSMYLLPPCLVSALAASTSSPWSSLQHYGPYLNVRFKEQNVLHFVKIKVCLWNIMTPAATESEKAVFSTKVKVKVTRSLTFMSFERTSLSEYICQIWSLYLLRFKSYSEMLKLTTDKQTNKQTG